MIVSDWKRITKEVPLEGLRPERVAAIQTHLEQSDLSGVLSDALMCVLKVLQPGPQHP